MGNKSSVSKSVKLAYEPDGLELYATTLPGHVKHPAKKADECTRLLMDTSQEEQGCGSVSSCRDKLKKHFLFVFLHVLPVAYMMVGICLAIRCDPLSLSTLFPLSHGFVGVIAGIAYRLKSRTAENKPWEKHNVLEKIVYVVFAVSVSVYAVWYVMSFFLLAGIYGIKAPGDLVVGGISCAGFVFASIWTYTLGIIMLFFVCAAICANPEICMNPKLFV